MKRIWRLSDQVTRVLNTAEQLINQGKTIIWDSLFIKVAQHTHITASDSRAMGSTPRKH